jgi:hypothetical protein
MTSIWLFIFENLFNVASKTKKKKLKHFFGCHLEGHWRKFQDPAPDPNPLVKGTDPQIRIRTKMSWIRNIGSGTAKGSFLAVTKIGPHIYFIFSSVNILSGVPDASGAWKSFV